MRFVRAIASPLFDTSNATMPPPPPGAATAPTRFGKIGSNSYKQTPIAHKTQKAPGFLFLRRKSGVITVLAYKMDPCPHPYRVRPQLHGLSHGLKSVHRTLFTSSATRPPFQVPHTKKKTDSQSCPFLFGGRGGT